MPGRRRCDAAATASGRPTTGDGAILGLNGSRRGGRSVRLAWRRRLWRLAAVLLVVTSGTGTVVVSGARRRWRAPRPIRAAPARALGATPRCDRARRGRAGRGRAPGHRPAPGRCRGSPMRSRRRAGTARALPPSASGQVLNLAALSRRRSGRRPVARRSGADAGATAGDGAGGAGGRVGAGPRRPESRDRLGARRAARDRAGDGGEDHRRPRGAAVRDGGRPPDAQGPRRRDAREDQGPRRRPMTVSGWLAIGAAIAALWRPIGRGPRGRAGGRRCRHRAVGRDPDARGRSGGISRLPAGLLVAGGVLALALRLVARGLRGAAPLAPLPGRQRPVDGDRRDAEPEPRRPADRDGPDRSARRQRMARRRRTLPRYPEVEPGVVVTVDGSIERAAGRAVRRLPRLESASSARSGRGRSP